MRVLRREDVLATEAVSESAPPSGSVSGGTVATDATDADRARFRGLAFAADGVRDRERDLPDSGSTGTSASKGTQGLCLRKHSSHVVTSLLGSLDIQQCIEWHRWHFVSCNGVQIRGRMNKLQYLP